MGGKRWFNLLSEVADRCTSEINLRWFAKFRWLLVSSTSAGAHLLHASTAASCHLHLWHVNWATEICPSARLFRPSTTSAFITTRAHARSAYASCMGDHKEQPLGSEAELAAAACESEYSEVMWSWLGPIRLLWVIEPFKSKNDYLIVISEERRVCLGFFFLFENMLVGKVSIFYTHKK